MKNKPKRYYWLKQHMTFFQDPKIKKLRKIAGGDTYTIIYQKLMLLCVPTDGIILFKGIEKTFVEELSLIIDEDETNISVTINYMLAQGLLEEIEDCKFLLPEVPYCIGSESSSAERVRNHRKKKKDSLLHSNIDETKVKHLSNVEIELEKEKKINTHNKQERVDEWLSEKSKNASNPDAYMTTMKRLLEKKDKSVQKEYVSWLDNQKCITQDNLEKERRLNEVKAADRFDYTSLKGLIIDGKKAKELISFDGLSTVSVIYEDGEERCIPRMSLYTAAKGLEHA